MLSLWIQKGVVKLFHVLRILLLADIMLTINILYRDALISGMIMILGRLSM